MDTYIPTNTIDASESEYLYVMPSQIENAGKGLYTAIGIYENEIIALFDGEVISDEESKIRAQQNLDQYFINLLDGTIMDSRLVPCFAKYANDADGYVQSSFANNADITLDDDGRVCLRATRDIRSGEEVFCGYGQPYWDKHGI